MKFKLTIVAISFLFTSCASFTLSKESLLQQLKEHQKIEKQRNFNSMGMDYYSNNLTKIKCVDKNGQEVWLSPGKNMNFKITKLSDNKTVTMYFDTVLLQNDTLYGLKSRIVGGKRRIPVSDIGKVQINSEEPNVEPAN